MRTSRCLPAPLVSGARRGGEPPFEDTGRSRSKKFCPAGNRPKFWGRCTHYWWIAGGFVAKSLIVEQYLLTNWAFSSTKPALPSTKPAFSSTSVFLAFWPISSSFSFVYKEKRDIEASTKEGRQSTSCVRCLFFNPPVVLRFSRNWWIVVDGLFNRIKVLCCDPPVSTNPPWFSPWGTF